MPPKTRTAEEEKRQPPKGAEEDKGNAKAQAEAAATLTEPSAEDKSAEGKADRQKLQDTLGLTETKEVQNPDNKIYFKLGEHDKGFRKGKTNDAAEDAKIDALQKKTATHLYGWVDGTEFQKISHTPAWFNGYIEAAKEIIKGKYLLDSKTQEWFDYINEGGLIDDFAGLGTFNKGKWDTLKKNKAEKIYAKDGLFNFLLAWRRVKKIHPVLNDLDKEDFNSEKYPNLIKGSITLGFSNKIDNQDFRFAAKVEEELPEPSDEEQEEEEEKKDDKPKEDQPQGTVTNLPQGGTITNLPQGGTVTNLPQGGTVVNLPQGGTVTPLPQGGTVINLPQGGTVTNLPQGGTVTPLPQGGTVINLPQSGSTVNLPQGGTITTLPQGGTVINLPQNGTVTPLPNNGGTVVNLPQIGTTGNPQQGGTVINVPQGGTVTSLPQGGTTINLPQNGTAINLPQVGTITALPNNGGSTITLPQQGGAGINLPQGGTVNSLPQGGTAINLPQQGGTTINLPQGGSITSLPNGGTVIKLSKEEGTVTPVQQTGTVTPVQQTGTVTPVQQTGTVTPVQQTGTVTPVQQTGTVTPVQQTGTVTPVQQTGTVTPVQQTGTVTPVQQSTVTLTPGGAGAQANIPQAVAATVATLAPSQGQNATVAATANSTGVATDAVQEKPKEIDPYDYKIVKEGGNTIIVVTKETEETRISIDQKVLDAQQINISIIGDDEDKFIQFKKGDKSSWAEFDKDSGEFTQRPLGGNGNLLDDYSISYNKGTNAISITKKDPRMYTLDDSDATYTQIKVENKDYPERTNTLKIAKSTLQTEGITCTIEKLEMSGFIKLTKGEKVMYARYNLDSKKLEIVYIGNDGDKDLSKDYNVTLNNNEIKIESKVPKVTVRLDSGKDLHGFGAFM